MKKGLDTLLRLRQMELDALRREIGALNREAERIDAKKSELSQQLIDEQVYQTRAEGMQTFGSYAKAVNDWQDDLTGERTSVDDKINYKLRQVQGAFEALKTAEQARDVHVQRARKAAAKRENARADEAALSAYRRNTLAED